MNSDSSIVAIKGGLFVGLASIILIMLVYIIDVDLIVDWKYTLSSFIIALVLFFIIGKTYRNEHMDGFMTFGEGFRFTFIAGICSAILTAAFAIVLYNYIDPELPQIITEQALKVTEEMLENLGTPSERIDKVMIDMETDMANGFTVGGVLSNSWVWLLSSAFYGLIIGLIIKKSKPEFE